MRKDDARVAKAFGAVLRECRLSAGLSQEALAHDAGIERTYVSFMERGLRQPSIRIVMALAGPLGLKPFELLKQVEAKLALK